MTTCAICLSDILKSEKSDKLRCKHIYHSTCINKWKEKQHTCPVCRYVIGRTINVSRTPLVVPVVPAPVVPVAPVAVAPRPRSPPYEDVSLEEFMRKFNRLKWYIKIPLALIAVFISPTVLLVVSVQALLNLTTNPV